MPDQPPDDVPPIDSDASTRLAQSQHSSRTVGPYHLLQRVGEGGMGEVWLAAQTHPVRRQVALKIIKAGMDTAHVVARFEAERQALALMDHPAIATVFDAGTTPEGRPYFAMEYVKGEPITVYCDRHRLTTQARLRLFMRVCEGVQHAHQKGVIHRDLKPSNVLVTLQDNQPVPKIIDFGVAKATTQHLTDRTLFTELGVMIGTPEYMSPEQADLTSLDIDTRTDVYALGVLLYELLTGALPFDRKTLREKALDEIRRVIREVDPPKPSTRLTQLGPASTDAARKRHTEVHRLASELRGDLDWITMKCLEKNRTRRYGSASDLAEDILRHLDSQPVLAGPASAAYQVGKFVRRHRGAMAGGVAVAGALLLGLVTTTTMYVTASRARLAAEQERTRAEGQTYIANIAAADASLRLHETAEAKRRLAACPPTLRNWEWRYLSGESDASTATLQTVEGAPLSASLTPDGRYIVAVEESDVNNARVWRWDTETHRLVARHEAKTSMLPGSDGRYALVQMPNGWVVRDTSSWQAVSTLKLLDRDSGATSVNSPKGEARQQPQSILLNPRFQDVIRSDAFISSAFSSTGHWLATGSAGPERREWYSKLPVGPLTPRGDATVRVWDVQSGRQALSLRGHQDAVWALAFSADGRTLVSGAEDGTARVWDIPRAAWVTTLEGINSAVVAVAISRDGARVATASRDRTIRIWQTPSGVLTWTLKGHDAEVMSLAFNPQANVLASGSLDKTIRLWQLDTGREIRCWHGHDGGVVSVLFNDTGEQLVTGSADGTVRTWEVNLQRLAVEDIVGSSGWVDLRLSGDGGVIAGNGLGYFTTFDTASGRALARSVWRGMPSFDDRAVDVDQDGSKVVGGKRDGTAEVWDARSGRLLATIGTPLDGKDHAWGAAIRGDSAQIATPGPHNTVILWDPKSAYTETRTLTGHDAPLRGLRYSPDGSALAAADASNVIRLWDPATGSLLHTLKGHTESIGHLAFSPDSRWLASAALDGTVRIWETESGKLATVLRGHDDRWIASVAYSPDGSRLVTAARDRSVRVWDPRTGSQLLALRYRSLNPAGAMFTPDGRSVMSWTSYHPRSEFAHVWTAR